MNYSDDNVFHGLAARPEEGPRVRRFLDGHDFSPATRRAFTFDLRKFAAWFAQANREPFDAARVTVRDVADFRDHLRRDRQQAVASVNRSLCGVRKYLGWLAAHGELPTNPAASVKELRRVRLAPKGFDRAEVRRLLREVELRQDVRAAAIFAVLLYTGGRVSDLVGLELHDLVLGERAGTVTFRHGKGNKERSCPLPLPARKALLAYLDRRPPVESARVFVGERGPLTDRGVRALCSKYSALCGLKLHPHAVRHTFAHRYLAETQNDLVGLAQLLGHENLNTTARYTGRSQQELGAAVDRMTY